MTGSDSLIDPSANDDVQRVYLRELKQNLLEKNGVASLDLLCENDISCYRRPHKKNKYTIYSRIASVLPI